VNQDYFVAPLHVVACDLGPVAVVVNYRTGAVCSLMRPARDLWTHLARTGGDVSTSDHLDGPTARALVDQLISAGLLTPSATPRPWPCPVEGAPPGPSWGTQEVAAGRAPLPRANPFTLATAVLALLVVLFFRHCGRRGAGMARLITLLGWATSRTTRPATTARACRAVFAVRRAGLIAPGRVACLEESAAVVVMLALSRFRVTWRHGVAADPVRLHAWVETSGGELIAEPASTAQYTPLLAIPSSP
jgi:hypothetical protein